MSAMESLHLPILNRYRMIFRAQEPMRLSGYTGSAWRGLLGHGLRCVACVTHAPRCEGCLLQSRCVYAQVFENLDEKSSDGRYRTRPHPFVLTIPRRQQRLIEAGGRLSLEMALMGQAIDALPWLVQAMRESGRLGMGRDHARFTLVGIEQEEQLGCDRWKRILMENGGVLESLPVVPVVIPPPASALLIELITPLRMKRHGRLVGPREFQASDFLRQLLRRTRDIAHFHGEAEGIGFMLPQSRAEVFDRTATVELRWQDWARYSSRQKSRLQMGGVTGSLRLQGETLEEWWTLLWYGQWLHLGKATSMGLGQYRIRPLQACEPDTSRQSGGG
jgi:hypothetical protein